MTKLIDRSFYLNKLIATSHTSDIKVITGVRRCGKSKLLYLFRKYLESKNVNIIEIDFNDNKFEYLKNYRELENFVEGRYKVNVENYLLIDEGQMCNNFETAINSLHNKDKYKIYITGSNAFLLSSDLATLFTGRTFEIKVYPFSFKEFKEYFNLNDNYPAFDKYLKFGGMAGSYDYLTENDRYSYLSSIFKTSILRDINDKYHIRNKSLINKVSEFLADNISNNTSNRKIANFLTTNKENINHKTIGCYLEYLTRSFLFYEFKRFDLHGINILNTNSKYYLCDHAFKYSMLGTKNADTGRILENIVAVELLRRGYEVYTGNLYKKEIDFIAIKNGERIYYQVSDDIQNKSTFEREINSLLAIKDGFKKILIARTRSESYKYNGVLIIDIAEWLSTEETYD